MWVFSRFATSKHIPEVLKDSTLRAYPVPWRGSGPLCFTPLPDTKNFIEIRSGRGELIMREQYTKTTQRRSNQGQAEAGRIPLPRRLKRETAEVHGGVLELQRL